MLLHFNNPLGFWLLLAIPAVVAIHFLQQRSRSLRITTLFLLERAAPESRSGRTWDRLRNSLALWCQLLAILLACWVLVEPRWIRPQSSATVVIVLDDSASMSAFRGEAHRALRERIASSEGLAERVTWILMPSDTRQLPYYRGSSPEQALAAFDQWKPSLGTHDCIPAIRLARSLAGSSGVVWFVTDNREGVPPDQPTVGVGSPVPNVGFAGSTLVREDGRLLWKAYVQNRSDKAQQRTWWIESGSVRTPERRVDLAPGSLTELSGPFPEGADRCVLSLSPDAFTLDDTLPLQRPRPKSLRVAVGLDGQAGEFFRKLVPTIDGLFLSQPAQARLKIARFKPQEARPQGPAILLADAQGASKGERISIAQRVPARHPLMADLNWQAWLGTGAEEMTLQRGDLSLLWQGEAPLIVLGAGEDDTRSLLFNFNWTASNAERLPASVLLVRRFLEQIRDAQSGSFDTNYDCGAPVTLALRDLAASGDFSLEFTPARQGLQSTRHTVSAAELSVLRAPELPGFFVLRRGNEELVRASARYADPREGDFSQAETFFTETPTLKQALIERTTKPDPFEKPALLLIVACLLLSWMKPWKIRSSAKTDQ